MQEFQPTFWITPREALDPDICSFEYQRAIVAHAILYGGPLLISDSDFINNLHLRDAVVRGDTFIIPLIERGYIQFAIREQNANPIPLGITAERILSQSGSTRQIPNERFKESPEFTYVENRARRLQFPLDGAADRYHTETLRILTESRFGEHELPAAYREQIMSVIHEHIQNHKLTWGYFSPKSPFWDTIQSRLPHINARERFGDFLYAVTRGPYVTFIPNALGVSPIYSHEDRLGIDLWRGRYSRCEQKLEQRRLKRSRISLGDYVKGLASLSAYDIEALRRSAECLEYEKGCEQLGIGTLFPEETLVALHQYRHRIDHAVLKAMSRKATGDDIEEEYTISLLEKTQNELKQWCLFAVKQGVDQMASGLPSILEFGYQRLQVLQDKDDISVGRQLERKTEVHKEMEIARLAGSPSIASIITADQPSVCDIYTSVE